jgi:hypothetical protein
MIPTRSLALLSLATPLLAQGDADWPTPSSPVPPLVLRASGTYVEADRADLHGPIGVMGEHPVSEGAWQFSYRYERQDYGGLLDGKSELSEQDVFDEGYTRTPSDMTRETHLLTALYGYSEQLSVLITIPWISTEMNFDTDSGGSFDARTIGMGDVQLSGLYRLREKGDGGLHLNLGVSLPTGSHDEAQALPGSGGNTVKLPYPLQLGSGTVDVRPGLTWVHLDDETSWGTQLLQTLRFTENSDGYGIGNETRATAWVARQFREDLSGSLRIAWEHIDDYSGQDDSLDPDLGPSQDPNAQGGDRLHFFLGVNYTHPGGHRFAGEMGGPIFQDLNGPQLETDIIYRIGWQFSF